MSVKPRRYDYDWPGNIRELQYLVERSVRVADGVGAVAILGVPPSTLRSRVKKLGLNFANDNLIAKPDDEMSSLNTACRD